MNGKAGSVCGGVIWLGNTSNFHDLGENAGVLLSESSQPNTVAS